jgi:hypothetical protein
VKVKSKVKVEVATIEVESGKSLIPMLRLLVAISYATKQLYGTNGHLT